MRLIDKVARITILLALVGCVRSHTAQHDNQAFYGSTGFGYQWNNPAPYGDWFPVGTDVYEFGLKGPHGVTVQVGYNNGLKNKRISQSSSLTRSFLNPLMSSQTA